MEYVIAAIILAFLVLWARGGTAKQATGSSAAADRRANADEAWLRQRWQLAEKEKQSGEFKIIPSWFFDPVTDRQIKMLESLEVPGRHKRLTKGQASDLIGMQFPADDDHIEQLKFFKVSIRGMNETRARHELAKLYQDQANVEAWENRPANASDKDMARFVGIKLPSHATHMEANKLLGEFWKDLPDDDPLHDEWDAYEELLDEFADAENRKELYEIKKPSRSMFLSTIQVLKQEGKTIREMADDPDLFVERLLRAYPDLKIEGG